MDGKNCILVIRSVSDLRDGVSSCAHRCPRHCVQNKNHKAEQWSSAEEENEKLVFPSQARESLPSLLPARRPCPPAGPRALGEAIAWGLSTPLQPPSCPTSCLPFHLVPGSGKHFVGVKRVNLSICLHHPRHTVSENRIPVSQIILFLPATFSDHRTLNVHQVPVTAPLICLRKIFTVIVAAITISPIHVIASYSVQRVLCFSLTFTFQGWK